LGLRFDRRLLARASALFRDTCEPQDLAHHAVVRGADPRLFDALYRDLTLRLFEGRRATRSGARIATLHQGLPARLGLWLLGAGGLGLVSLSLAGNALVHGFRRQGWDGGAAHAAVTPRAAVREGAAKFPYAPACLGLIGAGLLLGSLERKRFWLVAHPAGEATIDLWIAGTSHRNGCKFRDEFEAFLARARHLDGELRKAQGARCAALGGSPGGATETAAGVRAGEGGQTAPRARRLATAGRAE